MSGVTINGTRIEPLSKDNYDTWRMQIEALLIKGDLWEYVNGDTALPVVAPNADTAAVSANAVARGMWKRADRKARSELILSIHPSQLPQVRNLETSREVWLKLESIYASRGPARKATLLKQLILQRMSDGEDVRDHMAKFFDAVDKLSAMEIEINGDLLSIMLLYSLPPTFDNFRVAIESRDELPSVDALKVKILEEYEVRAQSSVGNVVGGLAVKQGVKPRPKQKKVRSKDKDSENKSNEIHCYKFDLPGYKFPSCPACNSSEMPDKSKKNTVKPTNKPSAHAVDDSYLACHTVFHESHQISSHPTESRGWILDSGCTAHLCGDKSLFSSLDSSRRGRLSLASEASTIVEGKGAVRLPVSSTHGHRLIELQNILFVPDLRSNLMSVAKIADKGGSVIFRNDSVVDQKGTIKMEAVRRSDLYIIKEDNNYAGISEESQTTSAVWIWHNRLGHLNAKDLFKVMTNQGLPLPSEVEVDGLKRCEICLRGKMTALPFPKGNPKCTELLKIVHSDVVGPLRVQSLNGARWFVTFIDESSR